MALPIVAIVGRPNVGKSSLLNGLARRMVSIVEPTAGVTRDRVSAVVELNDKYFELVDTGGYGIEDQDDLTEHIEDLAKAGIVDPAKVTRSALENAASIAAMLLTTEALVAEKPEKEAPPPMPPGGPGGGGMPPMM